MVVDNLVDKMWVSLGVKLSTGYSQLTHRVIHRGICLMKLKIMDFGVFSTANTWANNNNSFILKKKNNNKITGGRAVEAW